MASLFFSMFYIQHIYIHVLLCIIVVCKITCPRCESEVSLSSSINHKTGKTSMSIHNFKRHFSTHTKSTDTSTAIIDASDFEQGHMDRMKICFHATNVIIKKNKSKNLHRSILSCKKTTLNKVIKEFFIVLI